jgi:hypothetical protein
MRGRSEIAISICHAQKRGFFTGLNWLGPWGLREPALKRNLLRTFLELSGSFLV